MQHEAQKAAARKEFPTDEKLIDLLCFLQDDAGTERSSGETRTLPHEKRSRNFLEGEKEEIDEITAWRLEDPMGSLFLGVIHVPMHDVDGIKYQSTLETRNEVILSLSIGGK
jgi:hypothetical protein